LGHQYAKPGYKKIRKQKVNMSLLEVSGLSKTFTKNNQPLEVLRDLNLQIEPGEFVSIVGASGCGKTTFLRILDGLEKADSGQIRLDGQLIEAPGHDRSLVFQSDNLFPWRNVQKNITFGLEIQGLSKEKAAGAASYYLNLVGLQDFEKHYPHELSGGMRQRVNLARALAVNPKVLLMDEPFAALDAQTREVMQAELLSIWQEQRKTVIFITHQIEEAVYLSDRVLVFSSRPGQVKADLKIDLPRPRNLRIKRSPAFLEYAEQIWQLLETEIYHNHIAG
jgi:NitT/TauT family transport system ATP-binding protein